MWIRVDIQKPPQENAIYRVFGIMNLGTIHECKQQFYAKWQGEYGWVDANHGEDLTGMNESITHWLDVSKIKDPIDITLTPGTGI